jgi:hypothetical protein
MFKLPVLLYNFNHVYISTDATNRVNKAILLNKTLKRKGLKTLRFLCFLRNRSSPNTQNTGSLFIYNVRVLKGAFDRVQSVLSIKLTTISGSLKNFNLAPNYSWSILKCCIGIELRREELGTEPISAVSASVDEVTLVAMQRIAFRRLNRCTLATTIVTYVTKSCR